MHDATREYTRQRAMISMTSELIPYNVCTTRTLKLNYCYVPYINRRSTINIHHTNVFIFNINLGRNSISSPVAKSINKANLHRCPA